MSDSVKWWMGLPIAAMVAAGCAEGIVGSGVEGTETRQVEPFRKLKADGAFTIEYAPSATESLVITADNNLLANVLTEVKDGTLHVWTDGSVRPKSQVRLVIGAPKLEGMEINGAGTVRLKGLAAERFDLMVNGAATVTAEGSTRVLNATINGSGTLTLDQLVAREAKVNLNGAGNATVRARESLEASIAGAGNIRFFGNPSVVKNDVNGVGRITPG